MPAKDHRGWNGNQCHGFAAGIILAPIERGECGVQVARMQERRGKRLLAGQASQLAPHLIITGMRVDRRRQRTRVPGEPLRQEQVPRPAVDARDGGMTQAVERIAPIKSGPLLPLVPEVLETAFRQSTARLSAEQRAGRLQPFAPLLLERPEPLQLRDELVGKKDVPGPTHPLNSGPT